ncbi:MAG TPA: alanyl-tRNA editing protein [Dyella sp.]|uniref:alanyl-tRNA editing protein n=1 Tax=Dyella sp. TaxID=1869338 RepID=UPI002B69090B|nr:alanyl-tRNA editing protein [Dyella sp.]HTV85090.1 alanyl-tRNA editing protein [Dyella sp.]
MNKFHRATRKCYYEDPCLYDCMACVIKVGPDYVELDRTVAYPEGGGQESDHGVIIAPDGLQIRFVHARKMYVTKVHIPDMPEVGVDGVVEHVVHDQDRALIEKLRPGMPVMLRIDVVRRSRLSLSHTASHLVYLGVSKVRPDAMARTLGCHIRTTAARFDFAVDNRFTLEELAEIQNIANGFVARNGSVNLYAHPEYPDARYWECEGEVIPCGGTHIGSTGAIGSLVLQRKSLGKGKERVACEFGQAVLKTEAFHAWNANTGTDQE